MGEEGLYNLDKPSSLVVRARNTPARNSIFRAPPLPCPLLHRMEEREIRMRPAGLRLDLCPRTFLPSYTVLPLLPQREERVGERRAFTTWANHLGPSSEPGTHGQGTPSSECLLSPGPLLHRMEEREIRMRPAGLRLDLCPRTFLPRYTSWRAHSIDAGNSCCCCHALSLSQDRKKLLEPPRNPHQQIQSPPR